MEVKQKPNVYHTMQQRQSIFNISAAQQPGFELVINEVSRYRRPVLDQTISGSGHVT